MKPFDLLNAPLEGINLIEASAGTGKTYNIEGLFIRLILELQLQADQILVLTFTNAASEELKERIRHKLVQARESFARGSSGEPLIAGLIRKYTDLKSSERLLHDTIIDFDKAAIFTIHGFCQRVLHENAFETLNLFDTELITNQKYMVQEVVHDFWRKMFYHAPLEFISFSLNRIKGPEYFYRLLNKIKSPEAKIIPELAEPALDTLPLYREGLVALKNAWPASREAVIQAFSDPGLNAVVYGSLKPAANFPEITQRDLQAITLVESMDHFTDPLNTGFPLFEKFERFTASKLTKSTKKNHTTPEHLFFDLCEELYRLHMELSDEMENHLIYLKSKIFAYAKSELPKRKKKENVQYFDDLLVTLHNALQLDSRQILAGAIRQKYKAALVDEFQDTDDLQYGILNRIFSQKDSLLFMIGDPKQAIYSFRGADIFSYMKAAGSAEARFTLRDNWRSQPNLITAVNTIFSNIKPPFVYDEIPFEKARSAKQPARHDDASDAPMTLWYLDAARFGSDKNLINKTDAVGLIAEAVGSEINRLITGSKPVEPGDIAVLVRTNDQAQLIKDILSFRNVPSVLYSTGNIFDSREAAEVEKILTGISDPSRLSYLKAALTTDIMGLLAEDLISNDLESDWWENLLARFRDYCQLWERYGFIRMFRKFLVREQVKQRLLSLPDGERRLTNVLHLAEILHRQSADKNPGVIELRKWLAEQKDPTAPRLDEYQLRLESDEKAVKIVTIHKSKGLEYPIVFCPFGWESSLIRDKEFTFHNIGDDQRLTLDLGSELRSSHTVMAQNEILSENLRLLYVALTRAQKRCYIAWGRIRSAETSALAYLLHGDMDPIPTFKASTENLIQLTKDQFAAKTNTEFLGDLNHLAGKSRGSIRVEPLPSPLKPEDEFKPSSDDVISLFSRKFGGRIDHSWRIASFSALTSPGTSDADLPDRDIARKEFEQNLLPPPDDQAPEKRPDENSIFSFPKGTRAGIFFHDVLEHYDFAATNSDDLSQLVTKKLQQYGYNQNWRQTVCRSLTDVFSVPLRPDLPRLKLASVEMSDRVNEMEFYYPLNQISSRSLLNTFKKFSRTEKLQDFSVHLENLEFAPATGFMKGYIDLVFQHQGRYYLVDWKSNYLGPDHTHYHRVSLLQSMQADLYTLQYHLYTLALHQYLQNRISNYRYENDFGGIFYIFIRGVDLKLGPEYGIYYDLPDPELIHRLGKALIPRYGKIK